MLRNLRVKLKKAILFCGLALFFCLFLNKSASAGNVDISGSWTITGYYPSTVTAQIQETAECPGQPTQITNSTGEIWIPGLSPFKVIQSPDGILSGVADQYYGDANINGNIDESSVNFTSTLSIYYPYPGGTAVITENYSGTYTEPS